MPETSPGSKKWRTSDWPTLLRHAASLIDTLSQRPNWTFGGGTSLAVRYEHRISYDIDIFVSDSETLTALSPARNPATRSLLAGRLYQFPGNYLKLQLDGGEIDFTVGDNRTSNPTRHGTLKAGQSRSRHPGKSRSKRCSIGHRRSKCAMFLTSRRS